jgi:hypothetical protein
LRLAATGSEAGVPSPEDIDRLAGRIGMSSRCVSVWLDETKDRNMTARAVLALHENLGPELEKCGVVFRDEILERGRKLLAASSRMTPEVLMNISKLVRVVCARCGDPLTSGISYSDDGFLLKVELECKRCETDSHRARKVLRNERDKAREALVKAVDQVRGLYAELKGVADSSAGRQPEAVEQSPTAVAGAIGKVDGPVLSPIGDPMSFRRLNDAFSPSRRRDAEVAANG